MPSAVPTCHLERPDQAGAVQWRFLASGEVEIEAWRRDHARYWHNQPHPQSMATPADGFAANARMRRTGDRRAGQPQRGGVEAQGNAGDLVVDDVAFLNLAAGAATEQMGARIFGA